MELIFQRVLCIQTTARTYLLLRVVPRHYFSRLSEENCTRNWQYISTKNILVITVSDLLTYILFYSFNPNTRGHRPKDIEHVKNSYNIQKAQYIQCAKMKNNQKVHIAKKSTCQFRDRKYIQDQYWCIPAQVIRLKMVIKWDKAENDERL
jgi:hypothetical protein